MAMGMTSALTGLFSPNLAPSSDRKSQSSLNCLHVIVPLRHKPMLLGHLPLSMSVAHQEQAQECSPLHSPCPELSASGTGPLLFIFICGWALRWCFAQRSINVSETEFGLPAVSLSSQREWIPVKSQTFLKDIQDWNAGVGYNGYRPWDFSLEMKEVTANSKRGCILGKSMAHPEGCCRSALPWGFCVCDPPIHLSVGFYGSFFIPSSALLLFPFVSGTSWLDLPPHLRSPTFLYSPLLSDFLSELTVIRSRPRSSSTSTMRCMFSVLFLLKHNWHITLVSGVQCVPCHDLIFEFIVKWAQ